MATQRPISQPPVEPLLVSRDPYLRPHLDVIRRRMRKVDEAVLRLTQGQQAIAAFAQGHRYFGLHIENQQWVLREWAPNATAIQLVGPFNGWQGGPGFQFERGQAGTWQLTLPADRLAHGNLYKLKVFWSGGEGERIPAYARRVVQDEQSKIFSAQVWNPPQPYAWRIPSFLRRGAPPLIYEAHVGMAQEEPRVGTYREFRERILPRIVAAGYNTLQLMAVQEHPYYGSFGYHVSSLFAPSSRFGTPDELKALVDDAHAAGLAVIMDLVHSHAVRNEVEGLSRFDGTLDQYFHGGPRGDHVAWDSRCFNYGKTEVLHFLLSNCRFWLEEYRFDGYRFDGVTSMLYCDHGLGKCFTSYDDYYGGNVDEDACTYLALANRVIHDVRSDALTVAEDVSGMPGLGSPIEDGGMGFDYRLAMGTPDYWIKLIKEVRDEAWHMGGLFSELTNRRVDEKTISYTESHDQALVGDQTLIFRLIERDMYDQMGVHSGNLHVDRGMALHKMIRLITLATAGHGYLNFMGNEFGHPEWVDFPREGNQWSYHYARRQWHLRDDPNLRYRFLAEFDRGMLLMAQRYRLLGTPGPRFLFEHIDDQVLAFERAGLLFVFNFNPSKSFTDYGIPSPREHYLLLLDTDATPFGGFGRLKAGQGYFAHAAGRSEAGVQQRIQVYLPARTALVLRPR